MIPVEEAVAKVLASCQPLEVEAVPLAETLGRFLAAPVLARETIPSAPLSAMDGYALRSQDTVAGGFELRCLGDIPAGRPWSGTLAPGQTIKIFTGSVLPAGADAVVMVEKTAAEGEMVRFSCDEVAAGQHIRPPGEVVRVGDQVLPAGVRVGPGHLGLLATLGYAHPEVTRRPRVAILPTGDELLAVDEPLRPGMVRDSNSPALVAQVLRTGAIPVPLRVAADDRGALRDRVAEALETCDVLITSGGVSMGDYDFVGEVLTELGCETHFTRVRTKPGKPVTFATRGASQVFGLPGNPVSSMVSFELFCRPALRTRMGALAPHRPRIEVELAHAVRSGGGRRDFQRARLRFEGGRYLAEVTGPQGSGIMISMAEAQALLELHEDRTNFAAGERVPAILLDECLEQKTS